jgi:hypothetical protein
MSKLVQAVTRLTFVRKVSGSILCRDINDTLQRLHCFSQSPPPLKILYNIVK